MMWRTTVLRAGGATAIATLALVCTGCAAQPATAPVENYKAPTMAPEQSLSEACSISREEVDRLVAEAEATITAGLEEAGQNLLSGEMPSFDFLGLSIGSTLDEVGTEITNSEVSASLGRISEGFTGFGEIEQPTSLLEVPAYIGSLNSQLITLTNAGNELQSLCNVG